MNGPRNTLCMPPKVQDEIIVACKSVPINKLADMIESAFFFVLTNEAVLISISIVQHFNIGVTYVYEDKIQEEFL